MPNSDYVHESGDPVTVGEHGEHDYVFVSGDPLTDTGVSDLVFESGTGIGGSAALEVGAFPSGAELALVRVFDSGVPTIPPSWPVTAGTDGARWSPPNEGPLSEPELAWATQDEFGSTITAADDRIYIPRHPYEGGTAEELVAADAATGEILWAWSPPESYEELQDNVLAVDPEHDEVYIVLEIDTTSGSTYDGSLETPIRLVAVDATTGDTSFYGPALENGIEDTTKKLYFDVNFGSGLTEGTLLCASPPGGEGVGDEATLGGISTSTGERTWVRRDDSGDFGTIDGYTVDMVITHSGAPAVGEGRVYSAIEWREEDRSGDVATPAYGVAAFDVGTGDPVWYRQDCKPRIGRVAYHDGGVYVAAQRDKDNYYLKGGPLSSVTRLDPDTGAVEWAHYSDRPGDYPPDNPKLLAVGGGRVAAISGDERTTYRQASVLDVGTGTPVVEQWEGDAPVAENNRTVLSDGGLYLEEGETLKCLNPETLGERWRAQLEPRYNSWFVDGGSIYAAIGTYSTTWYDPYRTS